MTRVVTRDEARAVNRYRGLTDAVLNEFIDLDQRAIEGGTDRFIELRKKLILERKLCKKLRREFSLDVFSRLNPTKQENEDGL